MRDGQKGERGRASHLNTTLNEDRRVERMRERGEERRKRRREGGRCRQHYLPMKTGLRGE